MIALDVNDPKTVSSPTSITVDLEMPNQKMLICSGIAVPEWSVHDDETIYHETAVVNLRQTVLAVEQATVHVGLASIGNGDTNFQFALDKESLAIDSMSQEMLLNVDMALMGDPSALDRFGYQVVAVVTTQATGISGAIHWARNLFDASVFSAAEVAQFFAVSAGTNVYVPPASGTGFGSTVYTPRAFGVTEALAVDAGGDFVLPYGIPGAPYNTDLTVIVAIQPPFAPGVATHVAQGTGPNPVILTVTNPGISGVDFWVTKVDVR